MSSANCSIIAPLTPRAVEACCKAVKGSTAVLGKKRPADAKQGLGVRAGQGQGGVCARGGAGQCEQSRCSCAFHAMGHWEACLAGMPCQAFVQYQKHSQSRTLYFFARCLLSSNCAQCASNDTARFAVSTRKGSTLAGHIACKWLAASQRRCSAGLMHGRAGEQARKADLRPRAQRG